jgi:Holliday junction resolvase RusA-like endonuclease
MFAGGHAPMTGALEVAVTFFLKRPRKYYRSNGTLKPGAPDLVATKPDLSKLMRSTEDAITGICFGDDAQIARTILEKRYGDWIGAEIAIRQAPARAPLRPADALLVIAYGAQG